MAIPIEHPRPATRRSVDDVLPLPVSRGVRRRRGGRRALPRRHHRPASCPTPRSSSSGRRPGRSGRGSSALPVPRLRRRTAARRSSTSTSLSDVLFTEPARHLALAHADDGADVPLPLRHRLGHRGRRRRRRTAHRGDRVRLRRRTPPGHASFANAEALAGPGRDLWVDFATDGSRTAGRRPRLARSGHFTLTGRSSGPTRGRRGSMSSGPPTSRFWRRPQAISVRR